MAADGSLASGVPASPSAYFLGVSASLSRRRWRERPADPAVTRAHRSRLGLSEPLARALAARGVGADGGEAFLRPTLKALFPDPSSFADMDLAASILLDALTTDRPMVVFADYDVDGATSAAQLVRWFRHMGKDLPIYVPDRIAEGFGPSPAAFRRLREAGAELVVTVDCGAAAHDALAEAARIGLDVVVVDHHLMRERSPGATALVNPNRADCLSGQGGLSASGVTFVLLAALNRQARARGLFETLSEPDLRRWLDLAALGAICDVTRLVDFNRAVAAQGLKVMSAWENPGLAALMRAARAGTPESAAHDTALPGASVMAAGFILGPRINAAGRIGRSDLGARLLSTDDPAEAAALAAELDALNRERRTVEAEVTAAATAALESEDNFDATGPVIVVARDGWHPGVVGIVASRLRERYGVPAVVIGVDRAADVGKGSGRSRPGVNLGAAVQAAFDEGLLLAGGGHAMAAGLTVRPAAIPELRAFLAERLADEAAQAELADFLDIDVLAAPSAGRGLLEDFKALAPYGPGNPEPRFALADVRVERPMALRGGHVRCVLTDAAGKGLNAIAWRSADTELGRRLLAGGGALHVAGALRPDDWKARDGAQLEIEDAADPRRA